MDHYNHFYENLFLHNRVGLSIFDNHLLSNIISIVTKHHYAHLSDTLSLVKIIMAVKPIEIYNLTLMSHVKVKVRITLKKER